LQEGGIEMFEIDKSIINETQKCRQDFSCLAGSKECLCEVEDSFSNKNKNKINFIKLSCEGICDYRMSFGYSNICNCPVRKEIYRLYHV
jgi:hypothetical protein